MNTIVLWYLVTISNPNKVDYSPPMTDLATCQFLKKNVDEMTNSAYYSATRCIQINTRVQK